MDRTPKMWPLIVMTADDLDRLSASVQVTGQRLDAILERFHRTHPSRMILLVDFLSSPASPDSDFPKKSSSSTGAFHCWDSGDDSAIS